MSLGISGSTPKHSETSTDHVVILKKHEPDPLATHEGPKIQPAGLDSMQILQPVSESCNFDSGLQKVAELHSKVQHPKGPRLPCLLAKKQTPLRIPSKSPLGCCQFCDLIAHTSPTQQAQALMIDISLVSVFSLVSRVGRLIGTETEPNR